MDFQKWQRAFDLLKLRQQADCLDLELSDLDTFFEEHLCHREMYAVFIKNKFRRLIAKANLGTSLDRQN